jgi:hypothetical protein
MRTYEKVKEEIIETNYLLALTIEQNRDEIVGRLKVKLNHLIDEALVVRAEEKANMIY